MHFLSSLLPLLFGLYRFLIINLDFCDFLDFSDFGDLNSVLFRLGWFLNLLCLFLWFRSLYLGCFSSFTVLNNRGFNFTFFLLDFCFGNCIWNRIAWESFLLLLGFDFLSLLDDFGLFCLEYRKLILQVTIHIILSTNLATKMVNLMRFKDYFYRINRLIIWILLVNEGNFSL